MLSYHFSKNLTKPIRQHFPGDIPGKLPKPPQSWPHAYGAQVVLYVIFFHGQDNRPFPGTRTDGERIKRTSGQPCLLRCERQRLQSRYDLPDRGHHLAGEEHPAFHLPHPPKKSIQTEHCHIFHPKRHTTFFPFRIIFFFFFGVQPVRWSQCVLRSGASLSSSLQSLLQQTVPNASYQGGEHLVWSRVPHDKMDRIPRL